MAIAKKESDEMFKSVNLDPDSWTVQARSLKKSAQLSLDELIRTDKLELSPYDRDERILTFVASYMMLSGFAIENVIKGLLICRLPKPKKLNDALSKKILSHKLIKLVPRDIVLRPDETDLLLRLETFTVWAGRYPMPKSADSYYNSVVDNLPSFRSTEDPQLINEVFFKFDRLITIENED